LSNTLHEIPQSYKGKAYLVKGKLTEILEEIYAKGLFRLYIDGGTTIRNFLKADLIDEMIITTIPVLLGGGIPLFTELPKSLDFECAAAKLFLGKVVQNRFVRRR